MAKPILLIELEKDANLGIVEKVHDQATEKIKDYHIIAYSKGTANFKVLNGEQLKQMTIEEFKKHLEENA